LRYSRQRRFSEPILSVGKGEYHACFNLLVAGRLLATSVPSQARSIDPEVRLEKPLEGRVARKPVNCIRPCQIQSSQIFEKTAIVYKVGGIWYVNRLGSNFLRRDLVLLTNTHSSELCSVDIVRLLDSGLHFPAGSLGLGQFVPYANANG